MELFVKHKIEEHNDGSVILLYIDPKLTEFSQELGRDTNGRKVSLDYSIKSYLKDKVPEIKAKTVKIMLGSLIIATFTIDQKETLAAESENTLNENELIQTEGQGVNIVIEGEPYIFSQKPIILNGTTYVPIRGVAEALGGTVAWDDTSKTVSIKKADMDISFSIHSPSAKVNGYEVPIESARLINNTTMVPLKFVSETLGMDVEWEANTKTVKITEKVHSHTVLEGETLWKVANKYGMTVDQIKRVNELKSDTLYVGQQLKLLESTDAKRNSVTIEIKGEPHHFAQEPVIINGTTFVPIRGVTEALGAKVSWNNSTKTVGITKEDMKISFPIGSPNAIVNGKVVPIEPPRLINSTTMVPLKFVSETLGMKVEWDGHTKTVSINEDMVKHKVAQGDTLLTLAGSYGVHVDEIKKVNHLNSDVLYVGQEIEIPRSAGPSINVHVVQEGETLSEIAERNGMTVDQLMEINHLPDEKLLVGQTLQLESQTETRMITHKVTAGETLLGLAERYNTDMETIKKLNNLNTDNLFINQTLLFPSDSFIPGMNSISYITHEIKSGDNIWDLSVQYGIPMKELLEVNNMTMSSMLSLGQKLTVPVHYIALKQVVSPNHGEHLDWWTEAQYLFPINAVASVTDLETGTTFNVKRTVGANHADSEPLTAEDAAIIKQVWGGSYSWKERAVIVEIAGRKIAASMSSMPHDVQYITNNNFNGHFDIHFKNSTRHKDGRTDYDHQEKINIAAGVTKS